MIEYYENIDSCVTDACGFLGIERYEFFNLAKQWQNNLRQFSSFKNPQDFYLSWQGDVGRSNLCVNILDQFSRTDLADLFPRIPTTDASGNLISMADIGCGTAALSFPFAKSFASAFLVDVPNMAQSFIRWRCDRHKISNVWTGSLGDMPKAVTVMLCVDVLEHIAESSKFFREMDQRLFSGGVLLLRTPWASIVPEPTHIPEAEADWYSGGGAELLAEKYRLIRPLPFGGVYHKQ